MKDKEYSEKNKENRDKEHKLKEPSDKDKHKDSNHSKSKDEKSSRLVLLMWYCFSSIVSCFQYFKPTLVSDVILTNLIIYYTVLHEGGKEAFTRVQNF